MQNLSKIQNLINSKPNLAKIPYIDNICNSIILGYPKDDDVIDIAHSPLFQLNRKKDDLHKLQGYIFACYDFGIISKAEFNYCMEQSIEVANTVTVFGQAQSIQKFPNKEKSSIWHIFSFVFKTKKNR